MAFGGPRRADCNEALGAVGDALYAIGGKWKLRVIIALSDGSKRFNELQRSIPGISATVLSNELKDLEMNGFVSRKVNAQATPVVVDYEVTEYCATLKDVVSALHKWGSMHRNRIKEKMKEERAVHSPSTS
ncbi:transcriptional regulator, HxlR family [Chitinophaga sp. YR573]|uniref:winged helix-turn-helix transcriptional regulator n=1 Tax=Chitinophaga sp. YR573 TaxID=1881040 RepID=UPI0008C6FB3A|nr:helix-turn-helix domain-containing protein [Chitinophaga sp. YR573]SEW36823.1 transcriptional regulator, HxlR family [Chitinophaga sp. YR573]